MPLGEPNAFWGFPKMPLGYSTSALYSKYSLIVTLVAAHNTPIRKLDVSNKFNVINRKFSESNYEEIMK